MKKENVFITAASFLIYVINGGCCFSFGLLLPELVVGLECSEGMAAFAGSLQYGLSLGTAILTGTLADLFGCHIISMFGSAMASLGIFLNVFASNVYHLYITNGLIAGIGMGFQYVPVPIAIQRNIPIATRNAVMGFALSGSGIGVFVFAPICRMLLNWYGWRGTYLIISGLMMNTIPLGIALRTKTAEKRSRPDDTEHSAQQEATSVKLRKLFESFKHYLGKLFEFSVMKDPGFLHVILCFFLVALGIQVPYLFLPSKAQVVGISKFQASLLISATGLTDAIGRMLFGGIGTRVSPVLLLMLGNICVGILNILSIFFNTFPSLMGYSVVYGLFYGNYVTATTTAGPEVVGVERMAKAIGIVFTTIAISLSITPPLAAYMWEVSDNPNAPFLFAGCTSICSGLVLVMFLIRNRSRVRFWYSGDKTLAKQVSKQRAVDELGDGSHPRLRLNPGSDDVFGSDYFTIPSLHGSGIIALPSARDPVA